MMPPVLPLSHPPINRTVRRRQSVFVAFFVAVFALAATRGARANFAPPPAEQRIDNSSAPAAAEPPAAQVGADRPAVAAPAGVDRPVPMSSPASAATPATQKLSPPAPAHPAAAPAVTPVIPPEVDDEESLRAFADEPTPHTRLNVAAWIGTGVTVALLGVAAFYGAKAEEKASDVDRLTRNFDPNTDLPVEYAVVANPYTSAVRDGKHDDRMAKGFAIAAGATAVTTAVLFIIDAVRKPSDDGGAKNHALVTPLVTAQSAGLGLGGTF